jgi:hypothetical protein
MDQAGGTLDSLGTSFVGIEIVSVIKSSGQILTEFLCSVQLIFGYTTHPD